MSQSATECPKCHAMQARRVRQRGFWQKVFFRRFGYYPWECRFCRATFMLKKRHHEDEIAPDQGHAKRVQVEVD